MAVTLTLQRFNQPTPDGTVVWDEEAGTVEGELAETVRALVDEARQEGEIASHPIPTPYRITAPLRDRRQLAAILARRYQLPEPLADALDETDEAEQADVQIIH